eukprot:scaffold400318_cov48-Prasinocladus_malaysianus.AAC.1
MTTWYMSPAELRAWLARRICPSDPNIHAASISRSGADAEDMLMGAYNDQSNHWQEPRRFKGSSCL